MAKQHYENGRGIGLMLIAVACFAFMDAALKLLAAWYPPMQVAALRGLCTLPVILVWVGLRGGYRQLWNVRWPLHATRGLLAIVMLASFAYALKRMPLAEAYTLFFIAPMLITALSVPLLGDRIERAHVLAIIAGFIGVLVVLRPNTQGLMSLAGLMVLLSAACYALSSIFVRILARTDSTLSIMFWMIVLLSVGASLLALPQWHPLNPAHWPILLAVAVFGSVAQYFVTEAFRLAQAAVAAPFEYTALGWGIALDWMLWQSLPDRWVFIGAAIIIASGIYLVRHERRHVVAEHP